jgi:hypothetical protein
MSETTIQTNLYRLKTEVINARAEHERLHAPLAALIEEHDRQIAAIEAKFEQENAELLAKVDAANVLVNNLESKLRTAIVEAYEAEIEEAKAAGVNTDKVSKQFGDGLSVRNTEKVEYQEADAVSWARENAPYLIQIGVDKKLFEAAMKQLKKTPEFVTITKVPSAVIKY